MGMFDGLEDGLTNPLFLGGLGLATEGFGGLQSGMAGGLSFRKQKRDEAEKRRAANAMQAALQGGRFNGMSEAERAMLAANPEMAQKVLSTIYSHEFDPKAQAEMRMMPLKEALLRAQTNQTNAHAGYYREAAKTKGPGVDVAAEQARLQALKLEGKYYRDENGVLQPKPIIHQGVKDHTGDRPRMTMPRFNGIGPREEVIGGGTEDQAVFPDVPTDRPARQRITPPVPSQTAPMSDWANWAKANKAATEANKPLDRSEAMSNKPSKVDTRNVLTDEDIQAYYDMKFPGTRGKGNLWRRDGTLQKLETTQSERLSHQMAGDALMELKAAREKLGTTGSMSQAMAAEWDVPLLGKRRPLEGLTKGAEDAGIAFRGVQASINDLLFALSGKQVTDKERSHYADLYMPRATDSTKLQTWKLDRMERFFTRVTAARKTGATDEDIAQMIQKEMADGRAQMGNGGGGAPAAITNGNRPRSTGGWSIQRE